MKGRPGVESVPRVVSTSAAVINPAATALAVLYARVALGAAFLSAVASRFGIWQGTPGMSKFGGFLEYTAEVNSFMPTWTIPYLAWAATASETGLGVALIVGGVTGMVSDRSAEFSRWVAWGSAALLALFGTAMAISGGIKSPLDYSVFSASACALLLAVHPGTRVEVPRS